MRARDAVPAWCVSSARITADAITFARAAHACCGTDALGPVLFVVVLASREPALAARAPDAPINDPDPHGHYSVCLLLLVSGLCGHRAYSGEWVRMRCCRRLLFSCVRPYRPTHSGQTLYQAMENNLLLRELLARSDHLMLPGDNGKGDAHYHHHHQVHAGARAQLLGFERRASPLGAPGHAAARVSCTFGAVVSSIWAAVSDRLICLRLHCVGVTEAREGAVSEAEVGEAAKASARPAAAARVNVRARAGLGARAAEEPVSRTPVQVQERVFRVQPKRRCASISQGKN